MSDEYIYPPAGWVVDKAPTFGQLQDALAAAHARIGVLEDALADIPWEDIEAVTAIALFAESSYALRVSQWLDTNAPQETPAND